MTRSDAHRMIALSRVTAEAPAQRISPLVLALAYWRIAKPQAEQPEQLPLLPHKENAS